MKNIKVYNTAIEVGIRALIIIKQFSEPLDTQQLIFYDYLLLHLGDVDEKYESLHPDNPFHATELFVRRRVIQQSIVLLANKGLIDCDYSSNGLRYKANEISDLFLGYFDSDYFRKLQTNAGILHDRFQNMDIAMINDYIKENVSEWKGNLEFESLFRGDDIEELWV